jgi:hypothetical protein
MDAVMSVLAPILEVLFFVGLIGSGFVVVFSFIEDFKMIRKHR